MSNNQQAAGTNAPQHPAQQAPATTNNNGKRKRMLLSLTAAIVVAGIGYGVYWGMYARHFENTDDAYVAGNVVQVTPLVGGTVVSISADDTQLVTAGQPLIQLDRADSQVALEQAEAQLAQAVREVRTLYVNNGSLAANVALREADVAKARDDLRRRQAIAGSGAVSNEEISHAQSALKGAESALLAAREQLASNKVLTDQTTVEKHPNVQRAAASLRSAYLSFARSAMPAPVTGYVAKRSVQVGQRVAAGAPLMAVVPLDQVWVDANFKEVQITHMRIGQPVTLEADVYGSKVEYQGKVAGFSAGTGSAFSLLPAQNATGNWIKVVQRLPVRIALDPQQLKDHPLRVGLSMTVKVDVRREEGAAMAPAAPAKPMQTDVYDKVAQDADQLIARIIAANNGGRSTGLPSASAANAKPANT
ncbi:Multidrug resistance efflux pump EmrA [Cupriavidus necator]|uniref:HlyD family efflux transporter periplasmic adaptor subunit n=1 Tax=Cupriavidus necator (strain ATCC 17699 / DSM 428 / KCTC 22496 / NCIMB 10442 / H16 / Stanier 337) TaxID=381666 RepID=Q0K9C8_CUPNH|nr:HlyD family efflux transporter periplasmic adaptor subunit [Cupriavidus necator]QCC01196.1 HlyD family efflux transporter periplasmic adaptor subunit [Cupriavidus necator H16]QQB75976.1 HlyD family efflux transporter periplasmic adaptor subunit [Cupriavidus necator]WKA39581.1 HlyD family efflux transporter periplasmic adaptor subunit [Cupriavidus necator]CAJ93393.1 multidrug efflux membrane fusion protein [Cupriavidus necator H16]